MIHLPTLENLPVFKKKVVCRFDFNLPIEDGIILDDTKIQAALPTLRYLLENNASRITCIAHLGRPKGIDPNFSLAPIAKALSKALDLPIDFPSFQKNTITLLENCRFLPKDSSTSAFYRSLGDCYVNDAFASSHRDEPSITDLPLLFGPHVAIGKCMENEIALLKPLLSAKKEDLGCVIGGAKLSTKAKVISSLLERSAFVALGGLICIPFLDQKHPDYPAAQAILEKSKGVILLPSDFIYDDKGFIADLGPKTIETWSQKAALVKNIFWNGPLGKFELPPYEKATFSFAEKLSHLKSLYRVAGGGETLFALKKSSYSSYFALSTGGGACLEYLQLNGKLPGIIAIERAIALNADKDL